MISMRRDLYSLDSRPSAGVTSRISILVTALILLCVALPAFGAGDFTIVLSTGDMTLDPLHAYHTTELQIATSIYEGLVSYHPESLQPVPGVAYRWDLSEDRKTYTFHLRERARFSNGDPVTAFDFRDSWMRVLNPADEGEYSFLFDVIAGATDYRSNKDSDAESVGIRALSAYVLEVELEQPASHFLSMLCHMTFAPVHEMYRTSSGWETSAPLVSNGPFSLSAWVSDSMVLERNERYWDSWNVALDRVEILFDTDPRTVATALNDGTVQWSVFADMDGIADDDIVQVAPLFATSYLYFRTDTEPWSDFRVRKGLSRIVPWSDIRRATTPFATDTLVPAMSFYSDVVGLTDADVKVGLELLAAAGYPEGRGLPVVSILVSPGSVAASAAEAIAAAWKEHLEVEVEIRPVAFQNYQRQVEIGGFTIGSMTWIGDFADPLSFLQMWTKTSKLNDARYRDDTYDELVKTATGETGKERLETLARAERRLLSEDVVVLPLSHSLAVNYIDLEVIAGWASNVLDVHPLKYIKYKTPPIPDWVAKSE